MRARAVGRDGVAATDRRQCSLTTRVRFRTVYLGRFRVERPALIVDIDERLVAEYPGVVPGRD